MQGDALRRVVARGFRGTFTDLDRRVPSLRAADGVVE
jgi:hypothetical protein